ncbi:MAG: hypothetical protein AAFR61_15180 [Bacteroidota bacterium]
MSTIMDNTNPLRIPPQGSSKPAKNPENLASQTGNEKPPTDTLPGTNNAPGRDTPPGAETPPSVDSPPAPQTVNLPTLGAENAVGNVENPLFNNGALEPKAEHPGENTESQTLGGEKENLISPIEEVSLLIQNMQGQVGLLQSFANEHPRSALPGYVRDIQKSLAGFLVIAQRLS